MKEKQFAPAENNKKSPIEGMASVNTFNPEEVIPNQEKREENKGKNANLKNDVQLTTSDNNRSE